MWPTKVRNWTLWWVLRFFYVRTVDQNAPCLAPSHYLNQPWFIVNWDIRNKLQWNFNHNTKLFIHENAHENIDCEIAAILSGRGIWVKGCWFHSSPGSREEKSTAEKRVNGYSAYHIEYIGGRISDAIFECCFRENIFDWFRFNGIFLFH